MTAFLIGGLGFLCIVLMIGLSILNKILYCNENNGYVNDTIRNSYKLHKLGIISRKDVRQMMIRKKVSSLQKKKDDFICTLDELKLERIINDEKYHELKEKILEM